MGPIVWIILLVIMVVGIFYIAVQSDKASKRKAIEREQLFISMADRYDKSLSAAKKVAPQYSV